jgi:hypothetical protein
MWKREGSETHTLLPTRVIGVSYQMGIRVFFDSGISLKQKGRVLKHKILIHLGYLLKPIHSFHLMYRLLISQLTYEAYDID